MKYCLVIFLFVTCHVIAAVPVFNRDITVQDLKLRLPRGISSVPLKNIQTFPFTYTTPNGVSTPMEYILPDEVWEHEQLVGVWEDKQGREYKIYRPIIRKGIYGRTHISRAEYDAAQRKAEQIGVNWSGWLKDLTAKQFEAKKVKCPPLCSGAFLFTSGNSVALAAIFKSGVQYVILVDKLDSDDVAKTATALGNLLPALRLQMPKKNLQKSNVKHRDDGWFEISSQDYTLLSNLHKNNVKIAQTVLNELQTLRAEFNRTFAKELPATVEKGRIRVFANEADYLDYAGASFDWTIGLFSPVHRELLIQANAKDEVRKRRESIRYITYHEGFHQFLHLIGKNKQFPIWFNEGHATYFEEAQVNVSTKRVKITVNKQRFEAVKDILEDPPLENLMALDYNAFYNSNSKRQLRQNYGLSWALVYYLRQSNDFPNLLDDYYEAVISGKDLKKLVNMQDLKKGFVLFWQQSKSFKGRK